MSDGYPVADTWIDQAIYRLVCSVNDSVASGVSRRADGNDAGTVNQ